MKFICLAYLTAENRVSPSGQCPTPLQECLSAGDEELRHGGHLLSCEILPPVESAMTIRVSQGRTGVTKGHPAESSASIDRIYLLEARDLNNLIQLLSCHPGAKAGYYEIRPVSEDLNRQPVCLIK